MLYLQCRLRSRLALKLFRGERAISRFAWHFTATHSSSAPFATDVGSVLHALLHTLQPGHGWITWFRVYRPPLTRPFQTRFRSGSGYNSLNLATDGNSPVRSTKSTPSPGGPKPSPGSDSMSAHGFRISFTPLDGVLFTFPSRYSFTIGHLGYLALEGGPPCFQRDFACPAVLTVPNPSQPVFTYGTLTLSGRPFQQRSVNSLVSDSVAPLPRCLLVRSTPATQRRQAHTRCWFRLFPFRSPLLREYSLFLRVLRCFSSPGSLDRPMYSTCRDGVSPPPGCPIRIPLDQRLPAAPQGVSSRGHVLLRPQTPRHPPCALLAISYFSVSNTHWWWLPSVSGHAKSSTLWLPTTRTPSPPRTPERNLLRQMSFDSFTHLLRC